jgi:hypothetical protein
MDIIRIIILIRDVRGNEVIMKVKSWSRYLVYMCLILLMVFWGQHIFGVYKQGVQKSFNFRPYYLNALMLIFYGGIGLLLGLEHLIGEIKKVGTWEINLPKIVLMVIPSLYFSLAIFIYYNNISSLTFPIRLLIEDGTAFINAFQIILGYSIITSFYRNNKEI